MKQKRGVNKTWIYILAIAIIILGIIVVLRNSVGLSPTKGTDSGTSVSPLQVWAQDSFGGDAKVSRTEQKIIDGFKKAAASGGSK